MKIDLETLCRKVEAAEPNAKAKAVPEQNQIIVTFANRPEVEIALLTPWYQRQVKKGWMKNQDILELLFDIRRLAGKSKSAGL